MVDTQKIEWVLDTSNLFTRQAVYCIPGTRPTQVKGVVIGFKTALPGLRLMILRESGKLDDIDYSDVTLGDKTRAHY